MALRETFCREFESIPVELMRQLNACGNNQTQPDEALIMQVMNYFPETKRKIQNENDQKQLFGTVFVEISEFFCRLNGIINCKKQIVTDNFHKNGFMNFLDKNLHETKKFLDKLDCNHVAAPRF